ncbi:hypothetical protein ACS0TY_032567 [Phlomoides rotata]
MLEYAYNRSEMKIEYEYLMSKLCGEQRDVNETINRFIHSGNGGLFFIYGYGGTGKTFIWKTLSIRLRSNGKIVTNIASSCITSLHLPGGHTTHSRSVIAINVTEDFTYNINQGSYLAELLIKTGLIIWDEAPMINIYCIEALNTTLKYIMSCRMIVLY